eukprot:8834121-Pyramimonas_sp.AAC.1
MPFSLSNNRHLRKRLSLKRCIALWRPPGGGDPAVARGARHVGDGGLHRAHAADRGRGDPLGAANPLQDSGRVRPEKNLANEEQEPFLNRENALPRGKRQQAEDAHLLGRHRGEHGGGQADKQCVGTPRAVLL